MQPNWPGTPGITRLEATTHQISDHGSQPLQAFRLRRHFGVMARCHQPTAVLLDLKEQFVHAGALALAPSFIKRQHGGTPEFATRKDAHFASFDFTRVWNPLAS